MSSPSPPPSPPGEHASRYHPEPNLTRDYVEIQHSLGSRTVEQNPPRPLTAEQRFALNRSYQVQLAARMGFWFDDAARSRGDTEKNKQGGARDEAQGATDEEAARRAWRDAINGDVMRLWGRVGKLPDDAVHQGSGGKQESKFRFFALCRERLEEIEARGSGVGLAEFQMVVNQVLKDLGLKLESEGYRVLKGMATE